MGEVDFGREAGGAEWPVRIWRVPASPFKPEVAGGVAAPRVHVGLRGQVLVEPFPLRAVSVQQGLGREAEGSAGDGLPVPWRAAVLVELFLEDDLVNFKIAGGSGAFY